MSSSSTSYHVLYVEDNPAEAHLLESALADSPTQFELTVLEDGETALQFIEAKPFRPDVIVLDLNIPRVDGLTVLAALKAEPDLKSIPVLVFVSPGTPSSRLAAELKADLCLSKPFDWNGYSQLGDVIRKLCRPRADCIAAG